jgi:hypothetical protein
MHGIYVSSISANYTVAALQHAAFSSAVMLSLPLPGLFQSLWSHAQECLALAAAAASLLGCKQQRLVLWLASWQLQLQAGRSRTAWL